MRAAVMFPIPVLMIVMITAHLRIIAQRAGQQLLHSLIRAAGNASKQADTGLGQSLLCPAANPAADEGIYLHHGQKPSQGAVPAAHGIGNFRLYNGAVLHLINLKLLGMAKMLENLTVFIGDCNFHLLFPP